MGAVAVGGALLLAPGDLSLAGGVSLFLFGTATASFFAMQFTGATTFTSPSGVEWEMRRALPCLVAALVVATGIGLWRALGG